MSSGEQIAQAAASVCDLQLIAAQVDYVAFEKHADVEQPHESHAQLRGPQLQFGGQVVKHELRQRDHEQQDQLRNREHAERRPSEE